MLALYLRTPTLCTQEPSLYVSKSPCIAYDRLVLSEVRINATSIRDWPRHPHRGLLVDTSRHFVTVGGLLRILDAMSYSKLNVLHWHIVDDQSFPYYSERFPNLSDMGAYHWSAVYRPGDVQRVVHAARDRGIRVLPEFDVPGHTRSWGVAYPSLLTKCYVGNSMNGLGPMDPTNRQVYDMLKDLFAELRQVFPEKYFHVGGDEVDLSCWASNPQIEDYMLKNNISSTNQLHALFMNTTIPLLSAGTIPVVWQEVFDERVPLPNGTLVQVWISNSRDYLRNVLSSGHRVVYSTCWYLDHLKSGGDWGDFYACDPREVLRDSSLENDIIGGEACMWGEVVDDTNLATRVWPRAAAVAERLWSAAGGAAAAARHRLEEHACRLRRRGIPAQPPNGPGFCLV
ncbi:Beta-hexosaminidase subunit beta [Eumeta japonica]|uniref:Chitooligosaccharidolytic beta-N-acetylglucosaminidase n=1 Tax=Eumeta variegata TaxID=151549 RepID=A0A4C1WI15_EUMVA|nr:Beta-hexosaminidase subunit beta [Eumeta japonica]